MEEIYNEVAGDSMLSELLTDIYLFLIIPSLSINLFYLEELNLKYIYCTYNFLKVITFCKEPLINNCCFGFHLLDTDYAMFLFLYFLTKSHYIFVPCQHFLQHSYLLGVCFVGKTPG